MTTRATFLFAALLALSACAALSPPVSRLRVADGAVTVAAPTGYCVDRGASRSRPAGSFVLMGSCASLSAAGPAPDVAVVLTALVSDRLEPTMDTAPSRLERYFKTPSGRAHLARDNSPDSVTILDSQQRGAVLYLRMRDRSPVQDDTLSPDAWRAIFTLNDRMTILSVRPLVSRPVSSDAATAVLRAFVSGTIDASTAPAPS